MTFDEHIAGEVQRYDFTQHAWVTAAELSDANVLSASVRRQCCADGAFEIGGAYAGTLSLVCRLPGFTRYGIKGARITIRRWFSGEDGVSAPIEGIFYVTDAKKAADIFTLTGQDAMGWTDVSSYNHTSAGDGLAGGLYGFGEFLTQLYQDAPVLQAWMLRCTQLANLLAKHQTGMQQDLLVWQDYDKTQNGGIEYCNNYIWTAHNAEDTTPDGSAWMYLYTADGIYRDDNPRSFLRWLAQAAGGFITVTKDGKLTLRQFVQPSLGDAVVSMADLEQGCCEVADYRLQLYCTSVIYDDIPASCIGGGAPTSNNETPYRICVEGNPFLNGFYARSTHHNSNAWGLAMSMYHYGTDRNCIARPFRVKVHTQSRYELGQRIRFPDWQDPGETETHDLYSVITGIEWTFRGGTVLSCGGEDSRVMSDCIRATKADKAVRELRSRCQTLSGK